MATNLENVCTCCEMEDSTTSATGCAKGERRCNYCYSNCKGKECKWKSGGGKGEKPKTTYLYTSTSCHKGPILVFSNGEGLEVYGSSRLEASNNFFKFDLVIGLGEKVSPEETIYSNITSVVLERFVRKFQKKPEHIVIKWPDMGVPAFSADFWLELAEIVKKKGRDRARHGNVYKVLMHCMGGHGRTGTALSIMGALVMKWDSNIMEKIREIYCDSAVETSSQIAYIEHITGIKTKGVGSKAGFESKGSTNGYAVTNTNIIIGNGNTKKMSKKEKKEVKKNASLPFRTCGICKKEYGTINEAMDCEKSHIVEKDSKDSSKYSCGKCEKVFDTIDKARECFYSHTKAAEDYFKDRGKWRKDYPI